MTLMELEVGLLAVVTVITFLLIRNFRLKREALGEIDEFMEENPDLMRAGGDEFFERWAVTSYILNSFGVTRSHYVGVVGDMKEFLVESAKEGSSGSASGLPLPFSRTNTSLARQELHNSLGDMGRSYNLQRPHSSVSSMKCRQLSQRLSPEPGRK